MTISDDDLKAGIARLSRHAFESFAVDFLSSASTSYECLRPLDDVGEDAFYQPLLDSYGGSIHDVYLFHFPSLELFRPTQDLTMDDPALIRQLVKVRNQYHGKRGQWGMVSPWLRSGRALNTLAFVTNVYGLESPVYHDMLIPAYQKLKRFYGLKSSRVVLGSPDSFVEKSPEKARRAFERVAKEHRDGVVVAVTEDDVSVQDFIGERPIGRGLFSSNAAPYEPVFVGIALRQRRVLHEFEQLLKRDSLESELEGFLTAHYRDLFGPQYDRIETQLWLRFPALDIAGKDRRLDVFLRNSVINDWELVELKRPAAVSRTHRDMQILTQEVLGAIHQIRNYARILAQDRVKRHFAALGIQYYEPRLSIIVGRTPQIPHDQWRWLRESNSREVKIATYDDVLGELRSRVHDRFLAVKHAYEALGGARGQ